MISIFVTPFFTLNPRSGFENAVLRDFDSMRRRGHAVVVLCADYRDINDSVSVVRIKTKLFDSVRMFLRSPFAFWARFKYSSLCLFTEELLSESIFNSVHLNQPWIFLGHPSSLKSTINIRCHNDDIKYLKDLKKLEKNIILKLMIHLECLKLKSLFAKLDSKKYNIIFYSAKDLEGTKPLLGPSTSTSVDELFVSTQASLKLPTVNSRLVFFGGGNRPNVESLEWLENIACPIIEDFVELYSSDEALCQRFSKSKWIRVHGYSKNILDNFLDYPIFIFPVFSGSGVKLKVVDALETGCFVITTPEGAAGISNSLENLVVLREITPSGLKKQIERLRCKSANNKRKDS
jgi:hypothetical protein